MEDLFALKRKDPKKVTLLLRTLFKRRGIRPGEKKALGRLIFEFNKGSQPAESILRERLISSKPEEIKVKEKLDFDFLQTKKGIIDLIKAKKRQKDSVKKRKQQKAKKELSRLRGRKR